MIILNILNMLNKGIRYDPINFGKFSCLQLQYVRTYTTHIAQVYLFDNHSAQEISRLLLELQLEIV